MSLLKAQSILAIADERTNSKPKLTITAFLSFSGYVSTINCAGNVGCSFHVVELNCIINSKCAIFELCQYSIQ